MAAGSDKINQKEWEAKYDELFEKTQEILKYYSCHNCTACCKGQILSLEMNEYNKILRMSDKITKNLIQTKSARIDIGIYELPLDPECPLLLNNKCKIYNNRPDACKRYPFEFYPLGQEIEIHLVICPMSVNILYDFVNYFTNIDRNYAKGYMEYYEKLKNIKENYNEIRLKIWANRLDGFIKYLKEVNNSS